MSAAADHILSRVKISLVYQALTGMKPRGHGDTWRVPAPWRKTSDLNVSLHDSKGTWFDHVAGEGGGILGLVVRIQGGSRAHALYWVADFAGIPVDAEPLSAEDRARWAQQQRDLPKARCWRRAAIVMAEVVLDTLKRRLFDLAERQDISPGISEVQDWTQRLARWQRIDGAELVAEYTAFTVQHPSLSAGMVHSARIRERAEVRALLEYFEETTAEVTV